jgi:hypothetical protein
VVVKAEKGGYSYSEIVAFTVTAPGGVQNVGPVNAAGLAGALASLTTDGTPEAPHTVKLINVDVAGDDWGTTVKDALDGVEKYIVLDLSACTATGNTITGGEPPEDNNFNIIRSEYIVGIILPDSLTGLGSSVFRGWTGIRSVSIPETAIDWGTEAGNTFNGCTNLSNITLPSGLKTRFAGNNFRNCVSLTSITIPALVPSIGSNTFNGCTNLTSVTFMGNSTTIANSTNSFPNNFYTYYNSQTTKSGVYTWNGNAWSRADLPN